DMARAVGVDVHPPLIESDAKPPECPRKASFSAAGTPAAHRLHGGGAPLRKAYGHTAPPPLAYVSGGRRAAKGRSGSGAAVGLDPSELILRPPHERGEVEAAEAFVAGGDGGERVPQRLLPADAEEERLQRLEEAEAPVSEPLTEDERLLRGQRACALEQARRGAHAVHHALQRPLV